MIFGMCISCKECGDPFLTSLDFDNAYEENPLCPDCDSEVQP